MDKKTNLREALLVAGIKEINEHGVSGFSVRRIADACNVSCAAPYRHFENKRDFIAAIIDYVNDQWAVRQEEILAGCGDSLREQIIEISLGYIRFLMQKPIYRSILMLKDEEFDNLYHKKRTQFGSLSQSLNAQLYKASGLSEEVWNRKLMMFRSLIFGVVFLFDAGEFEYNETTMDYLRYTMNREFDIL
jgi:AcrR family transcriptional regulator